MVELAGQHGIALPPALTEEWPPRLSTADERGWFRFQRLYDTARSVLRTPADLRRLMREIAEDERAEGSGWLELQADPSGFAARYGGITSFTELLLDAAREASAATGTGIAIILAANRTRHPLDARTIARLAAQFAGRGVVGLGLSNDERRGPAEDFERAFRIAERAGLLLVPHAGELTGPASVVAALDRLHASRIGHGVRAVEDPLVVKRLADEGVTCEVCPSSNVALGVEPDLAAVPVRALVSEGVPVALGADDPLLFGRRLVRQYEIARDVHDFDPSGLAELARMSVRGSAAPPDVRSRLLSAIDAWLGPESGRARRLQGDADQGGLGGEGDAERVADACDDLPGQGEQVAGSRAARIDQGERVLGRHARGAGRAVALGEAGVLDQPRRRHLDQALSPLGIRHREMRHRLARRPPRGPRGGLKAREVRGGDHRVREERARAARVRVARVENHPFPSANSEHDRTDLRDCRTLPHLDAESGGQFGVSHGPRQPVRMQPEGHFRDDVPARLTRLEQAVAVGESA
jgi:adenosine deaminase